MRLTSFCLAISVAACANHPPEDPAVRRAFVVNGAQRQTRLARRHERRVPRRRSPTHRFLGGVLARRVRPHAAGCRSGRV